MGGYWVHVGFGYISHDVAQLGSNHKQVSKPAWEPRPQSSRRGNGPGFSAATIVSFATKSGQRHQINWQTVALLAAGNFKVFYMPHMNLKGPEKKNCLFDKYANWATTAQTY